MSRIKGITIELNGDATGLETALKDVNKETRKTQTELKEVDRALNLNPGNVELVNQKMDLLADAVHSTSAKLNVLRRAQEQVEQQFKNGDIGESQYRAFQRELSNTEASLKSYQAQMQTLQSDQARFTDNQRSLQNYLAATGQSVDDLSQVLGTKLTNAIRNGTASADQLDEALLKIGRAAGHSGQDLDSFRNALRNSSNVDLNGVREELTRIGQAANEVEQDVEELTGELKSMAGAASAGITAFGASAGLAAAQFDNAIGQIQAGLDVTREEAEKLEEAAKNVWKAGFGESLEEVSTGLIRVKQNMKQIDGSEVEGVTKNALALAKTFDSDVNEVTRAANNLMVNFGISADEAFELLAYGARNGLNFSNELFDNVAEYSGLFKTLGFTAEEYFQTLQKGSEQGIYNLDYLNDVIKEFGIRIKDGSESTGDALSYLFRSPDFDTFMQNLQNGGKATQEFMEVVAKVGKENAEQLVADLQKGGKAGAEAYETLQYQFGKSGELMQGLSDGSIRGQEAMQMVLQKIAELDDPMERAQMGVALFGTKWEDLEETAMLSLLGVDGELENLEGSMSRVVTAQEQTFGQRWATFTRSAATSLEPLGKVLLDLAEQWLPKVIAVVEKLAKWFTDLSPVMQNIVVVVGAIVAALGPLLLVFSTVISTIGKLIPLFTKGSAIMKGFGVAAGALTGPVGIAIGIITALIAIGVALYKNWDTIKSAALSLWSSVSDTFKKIGTAISEPIEKAKNAISKAISSIKSFFSGLSLKIPEIKMPKLPRFKLDGEFSLNPPSVPKLSVQWNALGGIFTKPTIFNTANAGLQGVGEAGPEAILPLTAETLAGIGRGIAEQMGTGMPSTIVVQSILDGRVVAETITPLISQNQRSATSLAALSKGVSFK